MQRANATALVKHSVAVSYTIIRQIKEPFFIAAIDSANLIAKR